MAHGHEHEPPTQEGPRADAPSPGHTSPPSPSPSGPARSLKGHAVSAILALVFGMIGSYAMFHFLDGASGSSATGGENPSRVPYDAGPTTKDLSDRIAKLSDRVDE